MTNQTVTVVEGKTSTGIFWQKTFSSTSRDALVLVMGYGGSLRVWPPSFVEKLAGRFNVITYDNRGTGLSIIPREPSEYSIEAMADDIDAVVIDAQCPRFHLFGYSMGGCIALQYAHRYQDKVNTLFLMSATAGGSLYAKPDPEISNALANPKGNTLWEIYMSTFELMYSPEHFERCKPQIQAIYENSKHLPTSPLALRGHSHAFKNFDASGYVENITVPTLVVSGRTDRLMPVRNSINLAEKLQNSRLVLLPDCEHAAHVQEESTIIQEIENHCVSD